MQAIDRLFYYEFDKVFLVTQSNIYSVHKPVKFSKVRKMTSSLAQLTWFKRLHGALVLFKQNVNISLYKKDGWTFQTSVDVNIVQFK